MLTVEFDDEMILDEMLVSYYYSRRPTTVYHRFHKEYNGEMVMEYSGSVSIVRGLRIQLSKDSRHSEQEEGKVLHTSYLCSEAFHLRVERLC